MPSVGTSEGGDFFGRINQLLKDCTTVLDVGAGIGGSTSALKAPVRIGLDIHRPYLERWPPLGPCAIPLNLPAQALRTAFMPKSIDAVCFIDSLEHLGPKEARAALADAEMVARRMVVVFTPRGFFPQRNHDAWGLGGEAHQRHRSGWEPEDFTALGYDVLIFPGFHNDGNEAFRRAFGPGAPPVDALLAYKRLG